MSPSVCPQCNLATDGQPCPFVGCPQPQPLVRDALDDDIDVFGDCIAAFHEALEKPHSVASLRAAADRLAEAAAPFGRLRVHLNEAVAKTAVRDTMRRRLRERHEAERGLYDRLAETEQSDSLADRILVVRQRISLINTDSDRPSAQRDWPDLVWACRELKEIAEAIRS